MRVKNNKYYTKIDTRKKINKTKARYKQIKTMRKATNANKKNTKPHSHTYTTNIIYKEESKTKHRREETSRKNTIKTMER